MILAYVVAAVIIFYVAIYFIDKETFVDLLFKGLEIVAVAVLSLFIAFAVGLATQKGAIGTIAVGIVFYFFGAMIHPYIIEVVKKITKNIGKKTKKKTNSK